MVDVSGDPGEPEIVSSGVENAVVCDADGCDTSEVVIVKPEDERKFPPPWLPSGWTSKKVPVVDHKPAPGYTLPISSVAAVTNNEGFFVVQRSIALTFCPLCSEGDPMVTWTSGKW